MGPCVSSLAGTYRHAGGVVASTVVPANQVRRLAGWMTHAIPVSVLHPGIAGGAVVAGIAFSAVAKRNTGGVVTAAVIATANVCVGASWLTIAIAVVVLLACDARGTIIPGIAGGTFTARGSVSVAAPAVWATSETS